MSTRNRIALAIIALLISSAARSDGIYPGGLGFRDGINNSGTVAAPATPCSGTGLIFTAACNSQYIGIL